MDLWFPVSSPSNRIFDRLTMLKAALFDIFADHNRIPHVLDYVEMVNCFVYCKVYLILSTLGNA